MPAGRHRGRRAGRGLSQLPSGRGALLPAELVPYSFAGKALMDAAGIFDPEAVKAFRPIRGAGRGAFVDPARRIPRFGLI